LKINLLYKDTRQAFIITPRRKIFKKVCVKTYII